MYIYINFLNRFWNQPLSLFYLPSKFDELSQTIMPGCEVLSGSKYRNENSSFTTQLIPY